LPLIFSLAVLAPTQSSFWQFQRMVKHITGWSALFSYYGMIWIWLLLWAWGCCLAHDCCYERLKQLGCQPVLNGYQFHIVSRTVVCEFPGASCLCGWRACECDKQYAYCFKENLPTYEKNFKHFSGRACCGRHKLQCQERQGVP
uniref:Phospholipase A2-like central domain-containing protein n=1 Tax=Sus scrofa TaxID=9823 RepID=A0A8D1CAM7_PIG